MPFAWTEYVELAQFLQGQSGTSFGTEAADRSAVSRAYYAAYCHARNHARDRYGFQPAYDSRDHGAVRSFYQGRQICRVASGLERLRQWRNDCDYEDSVPGLTDQVKWAIDLAQRVIKCLK